MNATRSLGALVIGIGALAASCQRDAAEPAETAHATAATEAPIVTRNDHGEAVVHFDKEAQARLGIEARPLTATTRREEILAFGRVVPNPDAASTVRSPLAGILRIAGGTTWPAVGSALAAQTRLASVEPRLTAIERADIAARLATARGELAAGMAAVEAADSALKRARKLNAEDKNVSDRAVEEAAARVKSESIRRDAAQATIETLEAVVRPEATSQAAVEIATVRGGEVVEVLAIPGEFVDAGAPILRTQDQSEILVRVELPYEDADALNSATAGTMRLVSLASDARTFEARLRGVDPRTDPATQRRAIQVVITKPDATNADAWRAIAPRAGESMKVYFPRSSAPQDGFEAAAESVLHHAGKAWIWVKSGDEEFTRKRVDLVDGARTAFTAAAWARDASAVVKGAQVLLSAEIFAREPDAAGDEE
jgi:hypothetical protein